MMSLNLSGAEKRCHRLVMSGTEEETSSHRLVTNVTFSQNWQK